MGNVQLKEIFSSLNKDDWKKIKRFAQSAFNENPISYRDNEWFLVQCVVGAFVDVLIQKGFYEIQRKEDTR